jgi:branched-chain amino acid transport system substrate-binding protein
MSLETVKEFFGTVAWNALLASALALLVFAGGRVIFAVLRRLLRIEGFRFTVNLFLLLVAVAAFEYVFLYTWPAAVGRVLQVLTFVVGVFLAYGLLEQVVLQRSKKAKHPLELPRIVRDVLRLAVIVLAVLFALKAFLGLEPTALIATSKVLSAVIGLAMQYVLANIFAGVALQIGKPFRVGDWVTVYNQTESDRNRRLDVVARDAHQDPR